MISLNLPTEVQSPRVKGDGRYDELFEYQIWYFCHYATSVAMKHFSILHKDKVLQKNQQFNKKTEMLIIF